MKEIVKRQSDVTSVLVPLVLMLSLMIGSSDVGAKESNSYTGITQKIFDTCIKPPTTEGNKTDTGWAEYDDGNTGEVRLKSETILYTSPAELDFVFEPEKQALTYKINRKNFGVSEGKIWEGFDGTMNKCKK